MDLYRVRDHLRVHPLSWKRKMKNWQYEMICAFRNAGYQSGVRREHYESSFFELKKLLDDIVMAWTEGYDEGTKTQGESDESLV